MANPQLPGTMIVDGPQGDPWDQAFASYRQALVDLNGDGVPDVAVPTANTVRPSDRVRMRQAGTSPVSDPNGTGRLAERWTAAGVGAVDPFNATSWAVGKASPETGQWMRDVQARDPDTAMVGGLLTPFGAAMKGVGAAAKAVRMNPMLTAGAVAGSTLATPTNAGDGQAFGPQWGDVRSLVGLRDFTPMDREAFNTRFSEPMPPQPVPLTDYIAQRGEAVRNSRKPEDGPRATEANVRRAEARARAEYPTVVSQYERDLAAWKNRQNTAYETYTNDLGTSRDQYYSQPFSTRAPTTSLIAGYVLPAVAAGVSYGKMRGDRARAVSNLTDEIASGTLSPSVEALKRDELSALKKSVPQNLLGDVAERARYAAPGVSLSGVEKAAEDIIDYKMTPDNSGAQTSVRDRYAPQWVTTNSDWLPAIPYNKAMIDYGLRAALPFSATGVTGFGPAIKPQLAARSNAVLNDAGRVGSASAIADARDTLRLIDASDSSAARLADEAARQEQAALAEIASGGPSEAVRQRVAAELAQRNARPALPPPSQPSAASVSNRALPPPNAMITGTPQPGPNQGFQLTPPPNGGPPVRDPVPDVSASKIVADPRQIEMDFSSKFGTYGRQYSDIARQHVAEALTQFRPSMWEGNSAARSLVNGLADKFEKAGLRPIDSAELMKRAEETVNLIRREDEALRKINRRVSNPQQVPEVARRSTGYPTTLAIPAAVGASALNPMLQSYYGD